MSAVNSAGAHPTAGQRTREPVRPGHWRKPAVRADMVRRYVQGQQSMRQIAADVGCVYSTVNIVLTEEGVQKRSRGGSNGGRQASASSPAPGTDRARGARPSIGTATPSGTELHRPRSGDGGAEVAS
jgi:hypothetical protein